MTERLNWTELNWCMIKWTWKKLWKHTHHLVKVNYSTWWEKKEKMRRGEWKGTKRLILERCSWYRVHTIKVPVMGDVLGWPRISFNFFHNNLWERPSQRHLLIFLSQKWVAGRRQRGQVLPLGPLCVWLIQSSWQLREVASVSIHIWQRRNRGIERSSRHPKVI